MIMIRAILYSVIAPYSMIYMRLETKRLFMEKVIVLQQYIQVCCAAFLNFLNLINKRMEKPG